AVGADDGHQLPRLHAHGDPPERADLPVVDHQLVDLQQRHRQPSAAILEDRVPRYALITAGSAWTSAGVPSAIFFPKSSTVTRWETLIPMSMWCSISSTEIPAAAILRISSAMASISFDVRPAAGSSSSSNPGDSASARAISSRRAWPYARFSAFSNACASS